MTTAAQRIWEAIYAAEFVSRLDEAIEAHAEPDECDIERALSLAHDAANLHARRVRVKEQTVASRFRRRSR
jgi:hypothetical protein